MSVRENIQRIRNTIPPGVTVVAAAKTRSSEEIEEAVDAGIRDIGENYVQEGDRAVAELGEGAKGVRWHMIGDLQKNKINKALRIFDVIQTVDSLKKARLIEERVVSAGKSFVSVYLEINSGGELTKSGLMPDADAVERLAREVASMEHLRLEGLMTMGPYCEDPEEVRPCFRAVREIFDRLRGQEIPGVELKTLSMGMSDSYRVAIEEGANMVRIGTALFGPRPVKHE